MKLFIGVDAGASHTEAVAADETLRPVARRRAGPGAVRPDHVGQAVRTIAELVRDTVTAAGAAGPPATLVVGAAGAGREAERDTLERSLKAALGHQTLVQITTDAAIALEAAFHGGAGIVLNAGSGSIATARDPAGVVWRAGGLGWQFGDDGSGYALGRAALAAVGRAADGRGPATALSAALAGAIGATSLDDMVRWTQAAAPHDIASLARTVCETADAGDAIATTLVDGCPNDLALHLSALLPRFPQPGRVRVALLGGLLSLGSAVRHALVARVARDLPRIEIVEEAVDPPLGALAMAARLV